MGYAPLVSVIVPVYKTEKFIHRCIDSVLNQTYSNWEMILIDDGSPDACGQICDSYAEKDDRIHVIHQEYQGQGAARNAGLEVGRGDWLYFLDSDDFLVPEALEIMLVYTQNGTCDIVMAGYSIIRPGKRPMACSSSWKKTRELVDIQKDILLNRLPNFVWGKLYRKILWNEVRFPVSQLLEDMYVNGEIFFRAQSACVIPVSLYYYSYENENSSMRRGSIYNYILIKYGSFLAWEEHERIAGIYMPQYKDICGRNALIAGIKTMVSDAGMDSLDTGAKKKAVDYIFRHKRRRLPFMLNMQKKIILGHYDGLLNLMGYIRRGILLLQYKIRAKQYKNN